MKVRYTEKGVHLFDRRNGLNVFLDEVRTRADIWSAAPANVSIALTNRCNMRCKHCFAPKTDVELDEQMVRRWIAELDQAGCLGVGFGGGEPLLYGGLLRLGKFIRNSTSMACTVTTNGLLLTDELIADLSECVDFLRVSTNGRRIDEKLLNRLSSHIRTGVNYLLNDETFRDLEAALQTYASLGIQEVLLLPQLGTQSVRQISVKCLEHVDEFLSSCRLPVRVTISAAQTSGFASALDVPGDIGLRQYAHISADGLLKEDSTAVTGVKIGSAGVLAAFRQLEEQHESLVRV